MASRTTSPSSSTGVADVGHHGDGAPGGHDLLDEAQQRRRRRGRRRSGAASRPAPWCRCGWCAAESTASIGSMWPMNRSVLMIIGSPPVTSTSETSGCRRRWPISSVALGREPQVGVADELGPAEAVGAVGVAGLPVRGEVEHRLAVLVLQARRWQPSGPTGTFERQLLGRVRVELGADVAHQVGQARPGELPAGGDGRERTARARRGQHAVLGEDQLEDRVVGHPRPVDQLVEHVLRDAEGQHQGEEAHGLLEELGGQAVPLGDPVQLGRAPGDVAWRVFVGRSGHQRDLPHRRRI